MSVNGSMFHITSECLQQNSTSILVGTISGSGEMHANDRWFQWIALSYEVHP